MDGWLGGQIVYMLVTINLLNTPVAYKQIGLIVDCVSCVQRPVTPVPSLIVILSMSCLVIDIAWIVGVDVREVMRGDSCYSVPILRGVG